MNSYRQKSSRAGSNERQQPPLGRPDGEALATSGAAGANERRMQVRAYNHWAGLLGEHSLPSINDLDPLALPDFAPYSVLLDYTAGPGNPKIHHLGAKLRLESGAQGAPRCTDEVPSGSLLAQVTERCGQTLARQTPIGFDAEFVDPRGVTIVCRGICLPFSSDRRTTDFIYGVVNWKELADRRTSDELGLPLDQATDAAPHRSAPREHPLTMWADGPAGQVESPGVVARPHAGTLPERTAHELRRLPPGTFGDIPVHGDEFALLVARRLPTGEVAFLGEVPEDSGLLEPAAKSLLG